MSRVSVIECLCLRTTVCLSYIAQMISVRLYHLCLSVFSFPTSGFSVSEFSYGCLSVFLSFCLPVCYSICLSIVRQAFCVSVILPTSVFMGAPPLLRIITSPLPHVSLTLFNILYHYRVSSMYLDRDRASAAPDQASHAPGAGQPTGSES